MVCVVGLRKVFKDENDSHTSGSSFGMVTGAGRAGLVLCWCAGSLYLGSDECSVSRTSSIRNPHLLSSVNPAVLQVSV